MGRILITGSIAGFMPGSFQAVYNGTKAFLDEVAAGTLKTIPLAPEPMIRKLGLIYRKDKALSKAALGFIQVVLNQFGANSGQQPREPRLAIVNG